VVVTPSDWKQRSDRLTKAESQLLRYGLFDAVCQIMDASCRPSERKRLRQQRAALEKKLGYDQIPAADRQRIASGYAEQRGDAELIAFTNGAQRRLRAALKKRHHAGETLSVPKF
jgi:hypothetical protein